MSSAVSLIKRALQTVGKDSVIMPADPSLYEAGLLYLRSTLAFFEGQEIIIEKLEADGTMSRIRIPDKLSDDLNEPLAALIHIVNYLAVEAATIWRVPQDQLGIMNRERDRSYTALAQMYRDHDIPNIVPDDLLPIGSGSKGQRHNTFIVGELESKQAPVTALEDYEAADNINSAIEALND